MDMTEKISVSPDNPAFQGAETPVSPGYPVSRGI